MKKIYYLFTIIILVLVSSCEENELIQYDEKGNDTFVRFVKSESNLRVNENSESTIEIKVLVSTISDVDRTLVLSVNEAKTDALPQHYMIPTLNVTIPANSYEGTFQVTGIDDEIIDETGKQLAITIESFGDASISNEFNTHIVKIFEICPNSYAELELLFSDGWAEEISWEITKNVDGENVLIASVPEGNYPHSSTSANEIIELDGEGEYTFTIFDAYGDGMWNGSVAGSYKLTLCVETLASGGGNFGSKESTTFYKY